jgi:hypothetical protein
MDWVFELIIGCIDHFGAEAFAKGFYKLAEKDEQKRRERAMERMQTERMAQTDQANSAAARSAHGLVSRNSMWSPRR